jgi:formylglycine-generating enzyme required for sulfatase activity
VSASARLVGNPAIASAGLGTSVAVDGSGTRVAAGAPLADFTGMADRGSVTAWTRSGTTWSGANLAHSHLTAADRFGASLAWSTDDACLVIGSPGDKIGGLTNRGSAAVLSPRGDGSYQLHDLLVLPASGTSGSLFGTAVAASDAGVLIGAPKHTPPAGGTARLFAAPAPCSGVDTDGDGTDDCTDADDDNDGTQDGSDLCGRDANKVAPGSCGCGVADTDSDSDGTPNCHDGCPNDAAKIAPGQCGCGVADTDSDADGTANCNDGCPSDAAKTAPGVCGCGTPETGDTDGDELPDCLDFDDDNDGTNDTGDLCPLDAGKTAPGQCGCGVADTDGDSDGTANCNDGCPSDPAKIAPGACGCGTADVDTDADGLIDCLGGGLLTETATLGSTGVLSGDDFGTAVAADGDTIVVGIPLDDLPGKSDAGSARIYRKSGASWTQEATLLAPSSDAKSKDYFGLAVAVHGDVAVIGAATSDPSGITDAGAAYVFRRSGGTWSYEAKLLRPSPEPTDRFGLAVAVRGTIVAVGAPQANANGLSDSGDVTVFNLVAGVWTPSEIITSDPVTAGDRFGHALALGGTVATPTLAVGATGDDQVGRTNCGAVYVHTLDVDGTVLTSVRAVAAAPVTNAGLGASVAVSDDGCLVAAGAPLGDRVGVGTDSGLATAWRLDAGSWTVTDVNPPDHSAGERFGTSVAFASYGSSLVVGSPYDTVGGIAQRGSVAVFSRNGSGWAMFDRLTIAGGTAASRCGTAVAGFPGGIAVGAPKHTPPAGGTVRVFAAPVQPLAWATVLEALPDPNVVTDATLRAGIIATGLPWRVRDHVSQIEMLLVPPGTFEMGCSPSSLESCAEHEYPIHPVAITHAFYLGRYEVTQSEWTSLMDSNPSFHQGEPYGDAARRPVERVSWSAIQDFLSTGGLRLPSEAEWEFAYRAGTTTAFHSMPGYPNGFDDPGLASAIAWFGPQSGNQTNPVGTKAPNSLGLQDMAGNVWEMVTDYFSTDYYASSVTTNPPGPGSGTDRVLRGGGFGNSVFTLRASFRAAVSPEATDIGGGFRAAKTP